jgi:glycosyltransferase involved in cell wall biosynthesis
MNILFTRFPLESAFGGAEVQTLSLIKGLTGRGHEVEFMGSCKTLLEKTQDTGLKTQELCIGNPPVTKFGAISFMWRKMRMKRQLEQYLQATNYKLQAIFMLSLSEKLLLTDHLVSQGVQVFWVEHDRVGKWLTKNPWLPRLRKLSERVTTIVVSDLSKEIYVKMGWKPERVVAIPNGIDVERFIRGTGQRPVRPHARDAHATHFKLGCIARLTKDKGVDVLIDAIKDIPNVELTIVGQGPEEKHIGSMSKQIKIIPTTDVTSFYQQIDCLILPSRDHDPFGLVIAEAMSAGVPTICTDACGISAHLESDESIIIPAGDASALKEAIIRIQDKETWSKLSKNGPRIAQEKFSLEKMISAYEALI